MSTRIRLLLALAFGASIQAVPASAWWFEDDGTSWPVFDFHRYGGDVNRPPATPDRPYFHGDDAVPLGLRWHDLRQAEADAAAGDAVAAAASVRVEAELPARQAAIRHALRHKGTVHHRKARLCVPAASVPYR